MHVVLVRGSREERRRRGYQLRRHVVLMEQAGGHVCKVRSGGQQGAEGRFVGQHRSPM